MFSNESEDIIGILTGALDLLGIPWRRPRRNMVAVSRREGVEALDRVCGTQGVSGDGSVGERARYGDLCEC